MAYQSIQHWRIADAMNQHFDNLADQLSAVSDSDLANTSERRAALAHMSHEQLLTWAQTALSYIETSRNLG